MTNEQVNEKIARLRGWEKLPFPATPAWQRPTPRGVDNHWTGLRYWYCEDWQHCGELLAELISGCDTLEFEHTTLTVCPDDDNGDTWFTIVADTPTEAIARAWLKWREQA